MMTSSEAGNSQMIKGKTIYLRLADENDAAFILSLRMDEKLNQHLSSTSSNLSNQKNWLINYKKREKQHTEYYFIICKLHDDLPVGTVRLYDFIEEKNSFCWGSWILNAEKTKTSAIESALLVYEFAFYDKLFTRCHFDVRKSNLSVQKFHSRFGVNKVGETELDYLYEYSIEEYSAFSIKNKKYIEQKK